MLFKVLAVMGGLIPALDVRAQDYPAMPVTIVIPFTPGASNDTFGRYLADALSKEWKQTVVVENRPGAGGSIGVAHMAKSAPNGHTLVFTSSTIATNAASQKNLPFDPLKDIQPVSMVAAGDVVAVTGKRIPLPTLADVVKEAKKQKIFYATNGINFSTFAAELFNDVAGIKMEAVNYKGAADMIVDLGGGRVDIFFGSASTLAPNILSKTLTGVATLGKTRLKALPDIPTVAEAGYQGAEFDIWWGVFAPANTPQDVLTKLNASVTKVMSTPESIAYLEKSGTVPQSLSVAEFTKRFNDDVAQLGRLAKAHSIIEQ